MKKRVINLVIVDESGSMCVIERQALAGINETLGTIQAMQKQYDNMEQVVTLLTFDSGHTTFIYDNTPAAKTRPLKPNEYNPGGGTPLYDAIGVGIAKVHACATADDNVLVTIITDGEENCSREYNLSMVKNLIDKLKKEHWTFTFIGTDNIDVEGMAHELNIDNHLAFKQDVKGTMCMFATEREARKRYNARCSRDEEEPTGAFFSE